MPRKKKDVPRDEVKEVRTGTDQFLDNTRNDENKREDQNRPAEIKKMMEGASPPIMPEQGKLPPSE